MTAVKEKRFIPSKYQEDVFRALITTNKNLLISASAGSGKTTSIVEASKILPYGKKAIFVAFNKKIVNELKNRLPNTVECSTLHSLGARSIMAHFPGSSSINDKKQIKYIEPLCEKEGRSMKEKWSMIYQIDRIMKLMRATMSPVNRDGIEKMCERYAIDFEDEWISIILRALRRIEEYNSDPDRYSIEIDFQDMIALPVKHKEIRMQQYDFVIVDECQDLSILDQMFLQRIIKVATGRLISVGDRRQSIYSFRGADINSFDSILARPNTIQLPLSICYRSTKAIVRNAKNIYPEIEEWELAEEGVEPAKGKVEDIREGDMVVCRNNFPLIELFFQLIGQEKKAFILGKEIEQGLIALLNRFNSYDTTQQCFPELDELLIDKIQLLTKKGITNPTKHPKYGLLLEKIQILKLLFEKFETILEVLDFIEQTFDNEEREGVQLLTIHKAKGLECDRVFIIQAYDGVPLIPSKYAVTDEMLIQEENLRFVANTRAKKELFYLYLQSIK